MNSGFGASLRSRMPVTLLIVTSLAATALAAGFPNPARDIHAAPGAARQTAVLAGGCFWGVEAVFDRLNGVVEDPFGAGTCLILVGLFFAGKLYRMTLLTISD